MQVANILLFNKIISNVAKLVQILYEFFYNIEKLKLIWSSRLKYTLVDLEYKFFLVFPVSLVLPVFMSCMKLAKLESQTFYKIVQNKAEDKSNAVFI